MKVIRITAGPYVFFAELLENDAPSTCLEFLKILPFRQKLIQARWSGESAWIPLGDLSLNVEHENQMSEPLAGEILFYSKGVSETEILFPYGKTKFSSKFGELKGNFFLKIVQGNENLAKLGELILWSGAQNVVFELMT